MFDISVHTYIYIYRKFWLVSGTEAISKLALLTFRDTVKGKKPHLHEKSLIKSA